MSRTGQRTAIVTGAARRIGRAIAEGLLADGWAVVAHVHDAADAGPAGAVSVAADLAADDCGERVLAAAEALPPLGLLVNCAGRFAADSLAAFDPKEFDRHMAVNVRGPALLTAAFAARAGAGASIVNVLDAKLAAPNPDFLSYTLSKQALAGLTQLSARALAATGVRVNGVAPALVLRSPGQSEANFAAMHAHNPLGHGVTADDVVGAVRYLADAPAVTGQVIVLDGGQRFWALPRDVQFLTPGAGGEQQ